MVDASGNKRHAPARAREATSFLLPYPPSWNALYRFGKKRVFRTDEYLAWIDRAGKEMLAQRVPRNGISSPVMVDARVGAPDKHNRDLDNVTKSVGDICQNMNVIQNDSQIKRWEIYWSSDVTNGVLVTIITMPTEAS